MMKKFSSNVQIVVPHWASESKLIPRVHRNAKVFFVTPTGHLQIAITKRSLDEALEEANHGDIILLSKGVHKLGTNRICKCIELIGEDQIETVRILTMMSYLSRNLF
jgi:hypothetical protein